MKRSPASSCDSSYNKQEKYLLGMSHQSRREDEIKNLPEFTKKTGR
jgi:hypothetical protein